MTGDLDEALDALLRAALPGFFGGATPVVQMAIAGDVFEVDPQSAEAAPGEARPGDHTDTLPFDPVTPAGPYTLTRSPYPGPRRVRLQTADGDRIAVTPNEILPDAADVRIFSLRLRPDRDPATVTGVEVLYAVTAVFTSLKATQTLTLRLQSANAGRLEQAESLATAVIALNRQQLIDEARTTYTEGDYSAGIEIKNLTLQRGVRTAPDTLALTLRAELELKATRALREDEGAPIVRIRTGGRPLDPDRPVDIHIDVDA